MEPDVRGFLEDHFPFKTPPFPERQVPCVLIGGRVNLTAEGFPMHAFAWNSTCGLPLTSFFSSISMRLRHERVARGHAAHAHEERLRGLQHGLPLLGHADRQGGLPGGGREDRTPTVDGRNPFAALRNQGEHHVVFFAVFTGESTHSRGS